jgi:putative membrane protein
MLPLALLILTLIALVVSGIGAFDYFTWILEVAPVVIGAVALAATYQRFRLTTLLYCLIFVHALILMLGGHYTYAKVPLGFWMQDAFGFTRNHYDRIGHFAQGFVPAMIAREILIRKEVVNGPGWRSFLIVCICLAISALYELIEWQAAVWTGEAADAFLGTQGDPWDTQMDMFLAMTGALTALALLGRLHDQLIGASNVSKAARNVD